VLALGLLLAAGTAAAQTIEAGLPDSVANAAVDFYNDPVHLRFVGPTTVERDDTLHAGVAVLEGPRVLEGSVDGSVLVIDGDAELRPGASIGGDLVVIGGTVTGEDSASVAGAVQLYAGRLRYRREGYRIARAHRLWTGLSDRAEDQEGGRSDFLLTTGGSYNRVEGLPITFGPRIRTSGANPLLLHAFAIYRTESGLRLDPDRMGYYVRAEQFVGGLHALRISAAMYSMIDPIESWKVTDLENGLSTFLFHHDFRDHYQRKGAAAQTTWAPPGSPLSVTGRVQWERDQTVGVGSPWSLLDNGESWRPQPLVAEGHLGSAIASLTYDTRNDHSNPSTGWYVNGSLEQAFRSDLTLPTYRFADGPGVRVPAQPFGRFTAATVDVRRYNRVDPRSRLDFRLVAAGPLDGRLPPQRQQALGGVGSLPGYGLFSQDCGARQQQVLRGTAPDPGAEAFFPRYGCDSFVLFQSEFRGKLSFHLSWDAAPWRDENPDEEHPGVGWDFSPDWVIFTDAGRGWSRLGPETQTAVDVGAGVLVERLGLYFAVPLTGEGRVRVFARLGPRF
jgi:hypothetical protein